jgi:hypothetical protein
MAGSERKMIPRLVRYPALEKTMKPWRRLFAAIKVSRALPLTSLPDKPGITARRSRDSACADNTRQEPAA